MVLRRVRFKHCSNSFFNFHVFIKLLHNLQFVGVDQYLPSCYSGWHVTDHILWSQCLCLEISPIYPEYALSKIVGVSTLVCYI
jgi:hypothetical protein